MEKVLGKCQVLQVYKSIYLNLSGMHKNQNLKTFENIVAYDECNNHFFTPRTGGIDYVSKPFVVAFAEFSHWKSTNAYSRLNNDLKFSQRPLLYIWLFNVLHFFSGISSWVFRSFVTCWFNTKKWVFFFFFQNHIIIKEMNRKSELRTITRPYRQ